MYFEAGSKCYAGPHSTFGSASASRTRGPRFATQSGHMLSFPRLLIQEGQLSVTGESICTKNSSGMSRVLLGALDTG